MALRHGPVTVKYLRTALAHPGIPFDLSQISLSSSYVNVNYVPEFATHPLWYFSSSDHFDQIPAALRWNFEFTRPRD